MSRRCNAGSICYNAAGLPCADGTYSYAMHPHDDLGELGEAACRAFQPCHSTRKSNENQKGIYEYGVAMSSHLTLIHIQDELGELPEAVNEPACSAEFMVSRERVKARSLKFYLNALHQMQVNMDL